MSLQKGLGLSVFVKMFTIYRLHIHTQIVDNLTQTILRQICLHNTGTGLNRRTEEKIVMSSVRQLQPTSISVKKKKKRP